MAALKDIKRKIAAVKKTQQITRAMNMVAAAKLRGAQGKMENFMPYAAKFAEVMESLASRIEPDIHPLLIAHLPEEITSVEILAFSSDRGLCGSFNANTISAVERLVQQKEGQGIEVSMTLVGRKLNDYFRRRKVNIRKAYTATMTSFDYTESAQIAREAMDAFLAEEVQEVWMYYTSFESMAKQTVTLAKLLPIAPAEKETAEKEEASEYLCEPSVEGIMVDLLPKSVTIQVYNAMLQTSTSEHAARMAAMDNATKNCKEMIQDLTLVYNKARQAAITAELMDIVGGAEALRS